MQGLKRELELMCGPEKASLKIQPTGRDRRMSGSESGDHDKPRVTGLETAFRKTQGQRWHCVVASEMAGSVGI